MDTLTEYTCLSISPAFTRVGGKPDHVSSQGKEAVFATHDIYMILYLHIEIQQCVFSISNHALIFHMKVQFTAYFLFHSPACSASPLFFFLISLNSIFCVYHSVLKQVFKLLCLYISLNFY